VLQSRLKFGRTLLVVGLLGVALAACGRKGPLEAPPAAKNAIDLPDSDTGAVEAEPGGGFAETSPLSRPSKANRAIKVPESSFVLDPIL